MFRLSSVRHDPGWLAIQPQGTRIVLAHVGGFAAASRLVSGFFGPAIRNTEPRRAARSPAGDAAGGAMTDFSAWRSSCT